MDNTGISYNNFNPNEPGQTSEHCVVMVSSYGLKWFDWPCGDPLKGLCETDPVSEYKFDYPRNFHVMFV